SSSALRISIFRQLKRFFSHIRVLSNLGVSLNKARQQVLQLPRFYLTQVALFANELQKFGISPFITRLFLHKQSVFRFF
ncbi:hypothetical protein P6709_20350, partial [Jeotgalibacillus sp. ET6]|uniref:hypothetical protein n=1 Tax=Jeotgalibacillus sp. ET6 TaxID=3037260 RepID=UPI0024182F3D